MSYVLWATTMSAASLTLTISKEGVGGVLGLSPTVALRDATTPNSYFDWSDSTFKTFGWGAKYAAMGSVERGHYRRSLDLTAVPAIIDGMALSAEYHVDDGGEIIGDAHDIVTVSDAATSAALGAVATDAALVRKYHTNRMEETAGNPGKLKLYDDNDVTLLATHDLRDETGGAIAPTVLTPARRAKGV